MRNKAAKRLLQFLILFTIGTALTVGCGSGSGSYVSDNTSWTTLADQPTQIIVVTGGDRVISVTNSPTLPFGGVRTSTATDYSWQGDLTGASTRFVVTKDAIWVVEAWENQGDIGNQEKAHTILFNKEN